MTTSQTKRNLFRQAALEQQSCPQPLEDRMQLITAPWWMALGAICLFVLVVGAWGWWGRVATYVHGSGIFVPHGEFRRAVAPAEGILSAVYVAEGDRVEPGTLLAEVYIPADEWAEESLRRTLNELDGDIATLRQDVALGRAPAQALEHAERDQAALRRELASTEKRTKQHNEIRSRFAGTVVYVRKESGDQVHPGDVLCVLHENPGNALRVQALIPASTAKTVQPGQVVHVSPANTEPHRIGYVLGEVTRVGRYPATEDQLERMFHTPDLITALKGQDAAVLLDVRLFPEPLNPTGLRWSGKAPEQVAVAAGGICSLAVIVDQRPPLSYVLPWIRESLTGVPGGTP